MRLFNYLRGRPDNRPVLHAAVGCRRAWTRTDVKRLGGSMLLAAAVMQFFIWAVSAPAAGGGTACSVNWGSVNPVNNGFEQSFVEFYCNGATMTVLDSGSCSWSTITGSSCTGGLSPMGWPGNGSSAVSSGVCNCGGGCSGNCDGYCSGGVQYFSGAMCNTGCNCNAPPCVGMGFYSNGGTCGSPTCTGSCHYSSISDGGFGGTYTWSLDSSNCSSVSGCTCPSSLGGTCPNAYGLTTVVPCGTPGGTCSNPPPACSGNCNYVSIANGNGTGFKWSLESNNCTAGADNCSCPTSPAGPCPTFAGDHTSLSCGSTGASSCVANCTGGCTYTGVAKVPAGTGFKWELQSNTCNQEAQNCGCPADPGGDCPTFAGGSKTVACGSSSYPCNPGPCDSRGGDQDADGVCHDVDCDDTDRTVGVNCCKGTCTFRWVATSCKTTTMLYRWDGDEWKWESGDCFDCNYSLPTGPGETDGQTQVVECSPNVLKGTWVKIASNCVSHGTDVGKCICSQMPGTPGSADGDERTIACDEHCQDQGGDGDSDGCCYNKDIDDAVPSRICGCDCLEDPFKRTAELKRRFDKLPVLKFLRHLRGTVDPVYGFPWDGILEFSLPTWNDGPTLTMRLNFFLPELESLAAIVRPALLMMIVYGACVRFIAIFKT